MIMNAFKGLQSHTYILQIITQQELQKLTKILPIKLDFKDRKFQLKTRDVHKIEKIPIFLL